MPSAGAIACEANMRGIYAGGLVILLTALLAVLLVKATGHLRSGDEGTNAETEAPASKKFEERAPAAGLRNQSSRFLLARPAAKTGLEDGTVFSKARLGQGGTW